MDWMRNWRIIQKVVVAVWVKIYTVLNQPVAMGIENCNKEYGIKKGVIHCCLGNNENVGSFKYLFNPLEEET